MIHFEHWTEKARRFWCAWWGHDWREDGGENSPVIPLTAVCARCGKIVRLVP